MSKHLALITRLGDYNSKTQTLLDLTIKSTQTPNTQHTLQSAANAVFIPERKFKYLELFRHEALELRWWWEATQDDIYIYDDTTNDTTTTTT